MRKIRHGEQIQGTMVGDGWTVAERLLRQAGATTTDVRDALATAREERRLCLRYGDSTDTVEARIAALEECAS